MITSEIRAAINDSHLDTVFTGGGYDFPHYPCPDGASFIIDNEQGESPHSLNDKNVNVTYFADSDWRNPTCVKFRTARDAFTALSSEHYRECHKLLSPPVSKKLATEIFQQGGQEVTFCFVDGDSETVDLVALHTDKNTPP